MAVVVNKADALIEMVSAFDKKDFKKAKQISTLVAKNIQADQERNEYSTLIDLDRESKQLFPIRMRKKRKTVSSNLQMQTIRLFTESGIFEIRVDKEVHVVRIDNKDD